MATVTYSEVNSGGVYRLTEKNYADLEAAGWTPEFWSYGDSLVRRDGFRRPYHMHKSDTTMSEAIAEWERVTGQDSTELGCFSCCGPPHEFNDDEGHFWTTSPIGGSRFEDV